MTKSIDIKFITEIYSLLGEPNKLKIFLILQKKESCICEIIEELGLRQNLISHHVSLLKKAGILNLRKDGTKAFYSVNAIILEKIKNNTKILFNF